MPSDPDMTHRVIIAEDHRDTNDLIKGILESDDCQCVQVYDGSSAIDQVERTLPDLLVLDIMLPDMDGFAVCKHLKLQRRTNLVPIVMVTALADFEHRYRGLRVGANEYVTKPFRGDELLRAIHAGWAWRQRMRQHGMDGEIHFSLNSEVRRLHQLNEMLTTLFLHTGMGEQDVARLRQAVMEVGQNAIEWGNRNQPEMLVRVAYCVYPDKLVLTIEDEGPGFDPANLPHASQGEDPIAHMAVRDKLGLREGGFGIMVAKGMADSVQYNAKGNVVTLTKRLPPSCARRTVAQRPGTEAD